jgi:hypothetical protein
MAWQSNQDPSPAGITAHSLTGFDAAAFYLADTTSSASGTTNSIPTAVPTASDAADVFFLSSETDSTHVRMMLHPMLRSLMLTLISLVLHPLLAQIDNPTPSCITVPCSDLYSPVDFSYVDVTRAFSVFDPLHMEQILMALGHIVWSS